MMRFKPINISNIISRMMLVFIAGTLSSCSSVEMSRYQSCKFSYSDDVKNSIIAPELKKQYGDKWIEISNLPPIIHVRGRKVRMLFVNRDVRSPDAPYYVVELEDCGRVFGKSYEAHWPGTGD